MRMHSVTACGNSTKESSLQHFSDDENHPRQPKERSTVNPVMSPCMCYIQSLNVNLTEL